MLNIHTDLLLSGITPDEFWTLCHVAKRINKESICFPSTLTLRKETGFGKNKLPGILTSLVAKGYITKEQQQKKLPNGRTTWTTNLYTITTDFISVFINLKGASFKLPEENKLERTTPKPKKKKLAQPHFRDTVIRDTVIRDTQVRDTEKLDTKYYPEESIVQNQSIVSEKIIEKKKVNPPNRFQEKKQEDDDYLENIPLEVIKKMEENSVSKKKVLQKVKSGEIPLGLITYTISRILAKNPNKKDLGGIMHQAIINKEYLASYNTIPTYIEEGPLQKIKKEKEGFIKHLRSYTTSRHIIHRGWVIYGTYYLGGERYITSHTIDGFFERRKVSTYNQDDFLLVPKSIHNTKELIECFEEAGFVVNKPWKEIKAKYPLPKPLEKDSVITLEQFFQYRLYRKYPDGSDLPAFTNTLPRDLILMENKFRFHDIDKYNIRL